MLNTNEKGGGEEKKKKLNGVKIDWAATPLIAFLKLVLEAGTERWNF